MQEPPYLNKVNQVSIQNGHDPNNKSGIQRSSHLGVPTKYWYLVAFTILIPIDRFFDRPILMLGYRYHVFTYIPIQHWLQTRHGFIVRSWLQAIMFTCLLKNVEMHEKPIDRICGKLIWEPYRRNDTMNMKNQLLVSDELVKFEN